MELLNFYDDENGEIFIGVKETCKRIGLTERQSKYQVERINSMIVLKNGIKIFSCFTNGGLQQALGLKVKYIPIWLSSIRLDALNNLQYKNIINIINWCMGVDFDNFKKPTKIYSFESELRDEIYDYGYFKNVKITGKEIVYDFGRVDLEGIDKNNNKYIIELKKYKDYDDVISQCKRYKNGFKQLGQDIHIIICQYDCSDIKEEAERYGFECYEYKRELKIHKVA